MPSVVLTAAERNIAARYCRLWARWLAAERMIEEPDAGRQAHETSKTLTVALLRMEQEMGLTPAARTRLQSPTEADKADPYETLLNARLHIAG
jgi:phage terminase small subunit